MTCDHEFETNPIETVTEIRNAREGNTRGVQRVLAADVPCTKCGDAVEVRYGLMAIDGQRD